MDATDHTATCLGCGCTCTDIAVTAVGDRFVQVGTDCALGVAWIGDGLAPARVLSGGAAVSLDDALDAAAATCATATRRLLVYIADDVSAPAQRAAVALADRLQASVDGPTSDTVAAGLLAAQRRGRASATLGELKHRADVVVFWGVDPTKRYPRFIERFVCGPPAFAKQRKTIAIDVGEAMGPNGCVERLAVPLDREVDALTVARAVVRGRHMPTHCEGLSNVTELTRRLLAEAKYVAIVFDAEPDATPRDPDLPEALIAFTQALNTRLRAALFGLRAGGNRNGFESLLTWQTGYPFSVSFASGAPCYEADETMSERLARGRYDAVLVVGSTESLPPSIVGDLRKRPTVIIGPRERSGVCRRSLDRHRRSGHSRRRPRSADGRRSLRSSRRAVTSTSDGGPAAGSGEAHHHIHERPMTHERLRLVGGIVHDPANGIDGKVRDVCMEDGVIIADLPPGVPALDVSGMIVMPGGVDIHCHIASAGVNHARRLLADERRDDPVAAPALISGVRRSGTGGIVPSTFTTGYRYAALGYTTAFDAAVAPLTAKVCHASLDDTPIIDAGFFALMGNDEFLLQQIDAGERSLARDYIAWLLGAAGGYAVKVVNPGGIDAWKTGGRNLETIDGAVRGERVTPRTILETITTLANELRLPHPVHIHCNNLGVPGNVATTLDSMRAVSGRRAHFTHLQFHSYGGERGTSWTSAAAVIADYVNSHPEVSCDVGQVMFGPALTLSADSPLEYALHQTTGQKWVNVDIELETGCGIVPYTYEEKSAAAALQWVVGLELFLLSNDPWRMVLSTDHPNGGSFLAYPQLIELLMSRDARRECLSRLNPRFLAGTAIADDLSREYTLNEIAIITRAGPARILGLAQKGHLGVGADADVTVYQRSDSISEMFAMPRFVFKSGVKVVEEAQLRRAPSGRRLHIRPSYDESLTPAIRRYFDDYATMRFEDYPVKQLDDPPQNEVR